MEALHPPQHTENSGCAPVVPDRLRTKRSHTPHTHRASPVGFFLFQTVGNLREAGDIKEADCSVEQHVHRARRHLRSIRLVHLEHLRVCGAVWCKETPRCGIRVHKSCVIVSERRQTRQGDDWPTSVHGMEPRVMVAVDKKQRGETGYEAPAT